MELEQAREFLIRIQLKQEPIFILLMMQPLGQVKATKQM
jgi:hypothetical protein